QLLSIISPPPFPYTTLFRSLIGIRNAAREGSNDFGGLKKRDDLRAAGIVVEEDERKCGVAADHGGRVLEHLEERLMKALRGSVLDRKSTRLNSSHVSISYAV